jgi:MoaA/NifB/PqqE/SkfB family radical SAM enzyme
MWFYRLLQANAAIRSHRLKLAGLAGLKVLGARHLCLRFDPTMRCNLHCTMCQVTPREQDAKYRLEYSWQEVEQIAAVYLPHALQLYIGCRREPTMYKQFPEIVRMAKQTYRVPMVGLVTNGQLLTRDCLMELADVGLDELTVSSHGLEPSTYESLMLPARHQRHLELMKDFQTLRHTQQPMFRVRVNFVVSQDTLSELPRVLDVYAWYGVHVVQVRPMKVWLPMRYDKGGLTDSQLRFYRESVQNLRRRARDLDITLLANSTGVYATKPSDSAILAEEVVHYVSPGEPQKVRWWEESFADYCRRTHWCRRVIGACLSSRRTLIRRTQQIPGLLDYDVS